MIEKGKIVSTNDKFFKEFGCKWFGIVHSIIKRKGHTLVYLKNTLCEGDKRVYLNMPRTKKGFLPIDINHLTTP